MPIKPVPEVPFKIVSRRKIKCPYIYTDKKIFKYMILKPHSLIPPLRIEKGLCSDQVKSRLNNYRKFTHVKFIRWKNTPLKIVGPCTVRGVI
jgi:hypothetical protein